MMYYLAYGSNLSMKQMADRCPGAVPIGTARINGYRLLFKGSRSGSYLTIEKDKESQVPVVVWKIDKYDELRLDRYEGCPTFYYKANMKVDVSSFLDDRPPQKIDAIIYIMHEERKLGCPSFQYYDTCLEGYCRFGFDPAILRKALGDSVGKRLATRMLREVGYDE